MYFSLLPFVRTGLGSVLAFTLGLTAAFAAAAGDLLARGVRRLVVIHAPEGVCAVTAEGAAHCGARRRRCADGAPPRGIA